MSFASLKQKYERKGQNNKYENMPVGSTVRAIMKIVEGDKTRPQAFEGLLIQKKKTKGTSSFTLRKISFGVGVEKVIPLNSPYLVSFEVTGQNKVRRSKLYFLRNLSGKASKLQEIYGARRQDFAYLAEEAALAAAASPLPTPETPEQHTKSTKSAEPKTKSETKPKTETPSTKSEPQKKK